MYKYIEIVFVLHIGLPTNYTTVKIHWSSLIKNVSMIAKRNRQRLTKN